MAEVWSIHAQKVQRAKNTCEACKHIDRAKGLGVLLHRLLLHTMTGAQHS